VVLNKFKVGKINLIVIDLAAGGVRLLYKWHSYGRCLFELRSESRFYYARRMGKDTGCENFFYKEVIQKLRPEEKYNLNTQIRQASVSGTANIAEGYGRYFPQESIQFYRVSRASLYELKDHLISCHDNGYITDDIFQAGLTSIELAKVAINGYIKYVMRLKRDKR
jgi:four helix bundle protein